VRSCQECVARWSSSCCDRCTASRSIPLAAQQHTARIASTSASNDKEQTLGCVPLFSLEYSISRRLKFLLTERLCMWARARRLMSALSALSQHIIARCSHDSSSLMFADLFAVSAKSNLSTPIRCASERPQTYGTSLCTCAQRPVPLSVETRKTPTPLSTILF